MPPITDVVKHLIIINVLLYFGTHVVWPAGQGYLALFFPMDSPNFQPYQLVTHMFMHGSITHLLFNMYGLYLFGSAVERVWGPKRFLFYYLFCGFGALALQLGTMAIAGESSWLVGASGAVFGLLAAFGMMYPNTRIMLLFPPIPMKAKYFVLIYGAIELFLGVSGFNTGIAHFAHLGGAIFGALLILYWRKFGTNL